MTQYKTQYGTIFAVKEHNGAPAIMCRAEVSETWSLSSMITPFTPGAWTAEELQGQLDNWAATKGWQPVEAPASAEPPEIVDECSEPDEECPYLQPLENSKKYSCQCALCGDKFVNREICNKSFRGCGWYQDQQEKDARQDDEEEIPPTDFCQCRTCEHASCFAHGCTKECPTNAEESCLTTSCPEYSKETTPCNTKPTAPTWAAAATSDASAAPQPSQAAGTTTTSESGAGANKASDPPSPAELSSVVSENSPDIARASTASTASFAKSTPAAPAFDYSGLDDQTVQDLHLAEREVSTGKRLAEIGLRRMADGVAIAHESLCGTDATLCRIGDGTFTAPEKTFGRWCESVGLNRKAAERLLQVSRLFDQSSPKEEKVLETLGPTLLYAAAKPSAPPELVQAVKDGDITTHKQYQDLLARYNAERAAREQAEQQRDQAIDDRDAARDAQCNISTIADRIAKQRDKAERDRDDALKQRDAALRRAAEAEKQRDGAREALTASKLRGDKLKAENEALKAQPVEAQVVDEEEVNRRAQARADELTAPLREELEALRARHPTDLEEAEQAIRDAYDSAIYTGRVMENAWHTLRPLLPRMDAHRRELAINQVSKTLSQIQGEIAACL